MSSKMMNVITTTIELVMRLLVAVCASNFIINGFMAYETFQVLNTLYIMVPVTGFFFARRFLSEKQKLMVFIHLLLLTSVLFVIKSSLEDTVLVFGMSLVCMMVSLKKKDQTPFVPLDLGIILVGYILSDTLKSDSAAVIPAYSAVAYVVCFFIYMNMKNIHKFLAEHAQIKSFRADQALNVNTVMMAVFMLMCILAMLVAPRLHIQEALAVAGRLAGAAIVWLLRKFNMPTGGYELEFNIPVKEPIEEEGSGMLMLGTGEGSIVLDTIAVVIAVVLIVFMFILVIKALRQIRFDKISGTDVKEFIRPEFTDIKQEKSEKKSGFALTGTRNERVRKKYKRFVLKNKGKNTVISVADVPEHITQIAGGDVELTRIYEKARYSGEMVTEDELKSVH